MTSEYSSTGFRLRAVSLAILGLALGGSAAAQLAPGWYLGGNIGATRDDHEHAPMVRSGPVTSIGDDDRDKGYKLYGGYQFQRYFALEGGFFDLGSFDYRYTTPAGRFAGDTRFRGLNLDLVATLPVTERLSAFGRVGATYMQARSNFSSTGGIPTPFSRSDNSVGGKYGVGLEYAFTPTLAMRAEVERYHARDPVRGRGTIDMASVGLVYRFGAPVQPVRVVAPPPPPPPPPPAPPPPPPPRIVLPPPPPPVMAPPPPPPPPAPAPLPARPFRN